MDLKVLLHGFDSDPVFERHLLNINLTRLLKG